MRPRVAFLIAPLTAPFVFWAGSIAIVSAADPQARAEISLGAAGHSLFFIVLFGAPLAYLATAVVGVPLYLGLRQAGSLRWWSVVGGGALAGGLIMPLAPLFGGWSVSVLLLGALIGSVPAAVFYVLTTRSRLLGTPEKDARVTQVPV